MRTIKHFIYSAFSFLMVLFGSCQSDIIDCDDMDNSSETHTCPMYLNGSIFSFDGNTTRSAVDIQDGACVYVQFYSGKNGTAVYHKDKKEWTLTWTGTLTGSESPCSLFYLDNQEEKGGNVELSSIHPVYVTNSATYNVHIDERKNVCSVSIDGTLTPLLSRVRFKGDVNTSISVSGMKLYTSFRISGSVFAEGESDVSVTVNANNYTDYIYYYGPISGKELSVTCGGVTYTITNPLFSGGYSGVIDIPTEENYKTYGWKRK